MFSTVDRSLVRVIRQREPKLSPKDIVESIRRLDIRVESATPLPEPSSPMHETPPPAVRPTGKEKGGRAKAAKKTKKHFGVKLSDVIRAGLLSPPLKLFRKYKGQVMEATLLPDGSVEMKGTRYESCSTAAEVARSFLTGRRMNTNGWDFWQYVDGKGKKTTLFEARERYLLNRNSD
jgi:hypothetical protein